MMNYTDRRMMDALQGDGRLDRSSALLAAELISQGCSLEQALLGTRFLKLDEFQDYMERIGLERGEYALAQDRKTVSRKKPSLNRVIDQLLQKAEANKSQEILFTTTKQLTHVLFHGSKEVIDLPKSLYPALVMKLQRWSKSLGWRAMSFHHHHHDGLRLVRSSAKKHPYATHHGFLALESGTPGLYLFVKPDAFIREQFFATSKTAYVYHPQQKEEILREVLFGGTVLVSITQLTPRWWAMIDSAGIPVHLFSHG